MGRLYKSTPAPRRNKAFLFATVIILLSAAVVLASCGPAPGGTHQSGGTPPPGDESDPDAGPGDGAPPSGDEGAGNGEPGADDPSETDDDQDPDGGSGSGDQEVPGNEEPDPRPEPEHPGFALEEMVGGFTRPLYVTHAGDGSGRLFILEQGGRISLWDGEQLLDEPFLDISSLVTTRGNEQGLLSLAFAPDYSDSGEAYISYNGAGGQTIIARYRTDAANPNRLDPDSAEIIFQLDQPYSNHNGGLIKFGPDGYLYFGLGDGGSGGDPLGSGQDLSTLLGAMLRLDVAPEASPGGNGGSGSSGASGGGSSDGDGSDSGGGTAAAGSYRIPADNPYIDLPGAKDEIWAYGLRNPWRFSFDRETGDLYIADVGQDKVEEINFQPADSSGGENYGWNPWEGSQRYSRTDTAGPGPVVFPFIEYGHTGSNCSVTGGYVYRGRAIPDLYGVYLYGDYCSGIIWGAKPAAGAAGGGAASGPEAREGWVTADLFSSGLMISSFGEDEDGELYIVDHREGIIYRLVPGEEPVPQNLK